MIILAEYSNACVIQRESAEELLSRLDWLAVKPQSILSLGWGSADNQARLQERYPHAKVMTPNAMQDLGPQSIDLIFANLLFPWQEDFSQWLRHCHLLLQPEGVFMLSALGLDTLQELSEVVDTTQMPKLIDMHDLGDMLIQHQYADPVLDVNYFTLQYHDKEKLFHELAANNIHLKTKELKQEKVQVTYEVIYAHAFKPMIDKLTSDEAGVTRVPLSHIKKQLSAK